MARKLVKREHSKKSVRAGAQRGHVVIVACQHGMLWSTLYVIATTAYLLATRVISKEVLPSAVILLVAVSALVLTYVDPANSGLAERHIDHLVVSPQSGLMDGGSSLQRYSGRQTADGPIDGKERGAFRGHSLDGSVWLDHHSHRCAAAVVLDPRKGSNVCVAFRHRYTVYGAACKYRRQSSSHVSRAETS